MLLYHSFPRPAKRRFGRVSEIQHALGQLAIMMEWGLLLTPEELTIPLNPSGRSRIRPQSASHRTRYPQARACFTLARREELSLIGARMDSRGTPKSHSDLFGEFAIGLDPVRARRLGAAPVIYHYDDEVEVNLTREVLFRLRDLRNLMLAHARLEAKAEVPGRDTLTDAELDDYGYILEGEQDVLERIAQSSKEEARRIVDLLDTDRVPAWNLVDVLDIILNFFQTADSATRVGSLAYFQQREWRIVRLYGPHVRCYRLGRSEKGEGSGSMPDADKDILRSRLEKLDFEFFSASRLDESMILHSCEDRPFFDFVDEIVCPANAAGYVEMMLRSAGISGDFEELDVFGNSICFKRRGCK